jgi:hypothetical protein
MDEICQELKKLSEPLPLNQQGVPDYYRYMLSITARIKQLITQLENGYQNSLRSFESQMDEEF